MTEYNGLERSSATEELKPCPLCGGKARIEIGLLASMVAIVCPCASHVFYGVETSKAKTIERWNRRADDERAS